MSKTILKKILFVSSMALLLCLNVTPLTKAADENVSAVDSVVPSDVENVKATAGDGSVNLTWNVATDNVGVTGYKIYYGKNSVTQDNTSYELGPVDVGNKVTYSVTGLTNGQKYYFAVTAYDAAANESENYSIEVSATPAHGAADTEAPKVAKAEAVDKSHVLVTFSEAVQLPTVNAESAFSIKNDLTTTLLEVKSAKMDTQDSSNKSVLLETADQQAGAAYVLTVGINLKDLAGNPIISGTSDTAAFTGTDINPQTPGQNVGPELKSVKATDATHVEVVFSEPVTLKADGRENFILTEEQNLQNTLDVVKADLSADKTKVTLTTAPQKNVQYSLVAIDVVDSEGKTSSLEKSSMTFMGATSTSPDTTQTPPDSEKDTTPPEDVTEFMAANLKNLIVTLSWKPSADTAKDLANYMLYMSKDGTTYGDGVTINSTATNFDVTDLVPKMKYFFKLTAKDKAGNESVGVLTDFTLPETGPEIALFALGSLAVGKFLKRKKTKK
jgi:hypothetical protein